MYILAQTDKITPSFEGKTWNIATKCLQTVLTFLVFLLELNTA